MARITVRDTSAELPALDEEDLEPVSSLGTGRGLVSGFQFGDITLPALELTSTGLLRGKVRALRAEQASVSGARVNSVEFTGCDLSTLRWTGGKVSRVRFDSCKLLGARFEEVSAEHVVFTGCKLDYGPPGRFCSLTARCAKLNLVAASWPALCLTVATCA